MKLVAVVQARMGSKRLPGKVMMKLDQERLLIDWVLQRVARASSPHVIVVATTTLSEDNVLVEYIRDNYPKVRIFRGSQSNVLSRFAKINELYPCDYILRVTADCPLVCDKLIDEMFNLIKVEKPNYVANCNFERIIKGFDLEFIASNAFTTIPYHELDSYELEHVTPYFFSTKARNKDIMNIKYPQTKYSSSLNLSIDSNFDLLFFRKINKEFDLFNKDFYQIVTVIDKIHELQKQ